jgi:hypothetical protein
LSDEKVLQDDNALYKVKTNMLLESRQFVLSNNDLILWGKQNILVHQFKDDTEQNFIPLKRIRISMNNQVSDHEKESGVKPKQDKVFKIYSAGFKLERDSHEEPMILVVIRLKNKSLLTIVYNLYLDREVSWHQGTPDTSVLFDNFKSPFCHENDVGIFQTNDKHTNFHFHVYDEKEKLLHKEVQLYGMDWGYRIYKKDKHQLMIGAVTLILPYNYQNIIQHYQPETRDLKIKNFYQSDFYMLDC